MKLVNIIKSFLMELPRYSTRRVQKASRDIRFLIEQKRILTEAGMALQAKYDEQRRFLFEYAAMAGQAQNNLQSNFEATERRRQLSAFFLSQELAASRIARGLYAPLPHNPGALVGTRWSEGDRVVEVLDNAHYQVKVRNVSTGRLSTIKRTDTFLNRFTYMQPPLAVPTALV